MSNTTLRRAVRTALAAGAVAGLAQSPAAFAQSSEDDVKDLGQTQVTGSRLPRADIETAQPITVIDREDIDLSGDTTVAEVLQTSVFNSFGSFRATSGFANGQAAVNEVSLRGLGSNRTLVLIDGRRIAATGGSGGAAQNLNQIPLSVVDRIEVLRDGASAIYGSDAIAGVINIITRKDFDGITGVYQQTFSDGGEVTQAQATVGVSSAKGNVFFSVNALTQRPQYYRDLDYAAIAPDSGGVSSYGFPGTAIGPSGTFLDPRCPEGIGASQEFPNSYQWGLEGGNIFIGPQGPNGTPAVRCAYNFAADVISVPRVRNYSAMVKGAYELTPNLRLNSKLLVSQLNSDTRFAGTPVTGPFPTIPAFLPDGVTVNPINPYQLFGLTDPETFTLLLRTNANGTRDNTVDEQIIDTYVGLEGETDWFDGSFEWQANVQFNRNQTFNQTFNLVNKEVLQNLLDTGQLDVFNVTPQGLDEAVQRTANHTGTYNAELHRLTVDVLARFDLGELPAGPISWAWLLEYNDTDFDQLNDVESNRGVIAGSAGGDNISEGRINYSASFEAAIPVLDNLDLSVAGRYETYNDPGIGGDFTPQVGIAWRPTEGLLLRASYGEGFRAPAFDELYGNISEGFPAGTDFYGSVIGVSPATSTQYRALTGGNPGLLPEFSKSWTYGFVYSPIEGLDIDIGFYHIEFENLVTTNTLGREFNADFVNNCTGSFGDDAVCNPFSAFVPGSNVIRNADGSVNTISLQQNNFEGISTEGIDVNIEYALSTDALGEFTFVLEAAKVLNYEQQIFADDPIADLAGLMGVPDTRINPRVTWAYGDFTVTTLGRYISGQAETQGGNEFTNASHTEIDFQVAYQLPWDATVAVGAQNIMGEEPEKNADFYGWEPFDFTLYNTLERVPYIRYEQNF